MINTNNPASASIQMKSKIEVEMEKAINKNFSSKNSSPKGMEGFENFGDLDQSDDNIDIKIMN